jgi:hypothetical protein
MNVAELPLSGTAGCGVPSTLKTTLPVGVPAPGEFTLMVAVKFTDWPNTEGLTEEVTAVVVFALFTVWLSAREVLAAYPEPPPYSPVIECAVTEREEVEKVATPPLSVPAPSVVPPSLNVTIPVGVPLPEGVTVPVKVTDWPKTEGFTEDVTAVVVLWIGAATASVPLPARFPLPWHVAPRVAVTVKG